MTQIENKPEVQETPFVPIEKIVSLCKRRGFVYPNSEIYGGVSGIYDFGPLGVELRNNIRRYWWWSMVQTMITSSVSRAQSSPIHVCGRPVGTSRTLLTSGRLQKVQTPFPR